MPVGTQKGKQRRAAPAHTHKILSVHRQAAQRKSATPGQPHGPSVVHSPCTGCTSTRMCTTPGWPSHTPFSVASRSSSTRPRWTRRMVSTRSPVLPSACDAVGGRGKGKTRTQMLERCAAEAQQGYESGPERERGHMQPTSRISITPRTDRVSCMSMHASSSRMAALLYSKETNPGGATPPRSSPLAESSAPAATTASPVGSCTEIASSRAPPARSRTIFSMVMVSDKCSWPSMSTLPARLGDFR
jgi:hypothetical protein